MAEVHLFIRTDGITLEYNDSALLMFTTDNTALITDLEGEGEYIRDTAIVNIVDSDSKCNTLVKDTRVKFNSLLQGLR